MPSPIGVARAVHRVGARRPRLLLQGEAPNQRGFRWLPLRQGLPGEDPPKEIHVWLHSKEGLAHGNKAGDMQHLDRIELLHLQAPLIEEPAQEPVDGVS